MKILLANKEKADAQIAHLQFAQADAQTKNCKRAISSNAPCKIHTSKKNVRKLS